MVSSVSCVSCGAAPKNQDGLSGLALNISTGFGMMTPDSEARRQGRKITPCLEEIHRRGFGSEAEEGENLQGRRMIRLRNGP
jgi:hypothetical protein